MPTVAEIQNLFAYNPETGQLFWRVARGRVAAGAPAGSQHSSGYMQVMVGRANLYAHRVAWCLTHNEWPAGCLDHKDGDRANNRLDNLRVATRPMNAQNRRKPAKSGSTGFLGVTPHRGRFRACIFTARRTQSLGVFDTPEAAHAAYVNAKRQLHEGCTI